MFCQFRMLHVLSFISICDLFTQSPSYYGLLNYDIVQPNKQLSALRTTIIFISSLLVYSDD
jgi:hypothetical protein